MTKKQKKYLFVIKWNVDETHPVRHEMEGYLESTMPDYVLSRTHYTDYKNNCKSFITIDPDSIKEWVGGLPEWKLLYEIVTETELTPRLVKERNKEPRPPIPKIVQEFLDGFKKGKKK